MELKATFVVPHRPVQLKDLELELQGTRSSWSRCSVATVGHYVYIAGKICPHLRNDRQRTVVPILDTVKNTWRWLPCKGPSFRYVCLALYNDYLYWLGDGVWHESGLAGVSRFDLTLEEWELCELKGKGPGPRLGCSMHVHERSKQLLFFGGKFRSVKQNDVHLLDLRLNRWVDVSVKGQSPAARWEHSSWMVGDEFYVFGGFTNEGRLPRDGLNVLHFGLNNVVTWSNVKEAKALGLLANTMVIPLGDSLLLLGGSQKTRPHLASKWNAKALTMEEIAVFENSTHVATAYAAVTMNSEILLFGNLKDEGYLRISLGANP